MYVTILFCFQHLSSLGFGTRQCQQTFQSHPIIKLDPRCALLPSAIPPLAFRHNCIFAFPCDKVWLTPVGGALF
ncbi:hypothetical protein DFJ73DRAFT_864915 [Zopfochytrium polystomum]|nr:hypothetical protein DFJ73DRAFT_879397 [Zopfochytrium polystomum]KAI9326936.1 hypothetical protein DFJ73DRAFT_864915 [Zopfochytrium polystomum]